MNNVRIGLKLILIGSLILIIPLTIVGLFSVRTASEGLESTMREQMSHRADELALGMGQVLESELKTVLAISEMDAMSRLLLDRSGPGAQAQTEADGLNGYLERLDATDQIGAESQVMFLANQAGTIVAASDPGYLGVNVSDRGYFQVALGGSPNIGATGINKVTNTPFVPMAAPVTSSTGEITGVFAQAFDLAFLEFLVEGAIFGETGYAYVVDSEGLAIAHPDESVALQTNVKTLAGMEHLAPRMLSGEAGVDGYEFRGVAKTLAFAPVPITGWSVALTVSDSQFLAPIRQVETAVLGIGIVSLLLAVIVFILFARTISKPLEEAVAFAGRVAEGDLTARMALKAREDEIGQLANSLRNMVERLGAIVSDVRTSSTNVASAAQQMSTSSEELSQGATEQAASAEEVSSSMEQMGSNISQNADNASQTEKIALKAAANAEEGGKAVVETVSAMKEIAEKITIIEEIARNTNLLALNAAIEAARAGEHGKGFAVVASEVRKLAERSQKASAEIGELSQSSVSVAERAGDLINAIVPDIRKTADLVQEINASSAEQNAGADQINSALAQLDQVVQQNASSSEEMASMAEELSSQAEQLQSTIAFFRVDASASERVGAPYLERWDSGGSSSGRNRPQLSDDGGNGHSAGSGHSSRGITIRQGGGRSSSHGQGNSTGVALDLGDSVQRDDQDDDFVEY